MFAILLDKWLKWSIITTVTSFSVVWQSIKYFIFTSSPECITPSQSLNEHGCLSWLNHWVTTVSESCTHFFWPLRWPNMHTARWHTGDTDNKTSPLRHEDNAWRQFLSSRPFPLCPTWCQPSVVARCLHVSIHLPVPASQHWDCQFHCFLPCVHTLSMMCPSGSRGSNTRWLLILGCSICYAGAPPSLVFHVERRRIRHVS